MLTPLEKNFYGLVRDGHRSIEDVPKRMREKVRAELIKNGYLAN